ncbi:hypothetical protein ON021_00645 [Microcoleus sp. HI-ES]|nr:hypothetical protein [Microcoleus sp. HI-ES]
MSASVLTKLRKLLLGRMYAPVRSGGASYDIINCHIDVQTNLPSLTVTDEGSDLFFTMRLKEVY